jgi:hypothetical protein
MRFAVDSTSHAIAKFGERVHGFAASDFNDHWDHETELDEAVRFSLLNGAKRVPSMSRREFLVLCLTKDLKLFKAVVRPSYGGYVVITVLAPEHEFV